MVDVEGGRADRTMESSNLIEIRVVPGRRPMSPGRSSPGMTWRLGIMLVGLVCSFL